MFNRNSSDATTHPKASKTLTKLFGDLKVRPKLMVLHNLFFLVLACAAYFSLIPLFEKQVADARAHELRIIQQLYPGQSPAEVLQRIGHSEDTRIVARARLTLFIVLGSIYVLAVLLLELAIMPLYVYRPLRLLLDADEATQRGDHVHELIDRDLILGDEIGQIMRSRNATVAQLRKHEDDLAEALKRLEEVAEDLKSKNAMLESAKRSLEEQDRLVSLGLLSASVAHELNTPLSVLHGSIEKLTETTTDRQTLDRLARMARVTQRLRRISEGLIDFAKVRNQQMEPITLRPLIEDAWSLVAIDEKASQVDFSNLVCAGDRVIGNSDRLIQVFVNLLRNSLNAVKSGGKIDVHSRPLQRDGRPCISITVDDNGPGIPPDVLPDIFDAFVTTRLNSRGTGLGLTVAEGIVTQHGGTISAANRPQGGACLEVVLPAATK